ncbi:MAG: YmdB family metallophosphoesterase [Clostridia bacterium]|nr:YmdB family metallophosphoesterase [Clostridia bacterium]
MSKLRILTVGDVVGPRALDRLSSALYPLKNEFSADAVIVNGENAAPGNGIDVPSAKTLLASGADVITTGNHVWQKRDIYEFLRDSDQIVRPANYPPSCPGAGYTVQNILGMRILVISVMGTIYMEPLESPFTAVDRILDREEGRYDLAVLDVHAEATSEKIALGHYFDGRIGIVFGTHTHTPTADLRILPGGTGYITDLGMVGPENSVLGVRADIIIEKLRTKMPVRFELGDGPILLGGACFTYDTDVKRVTEVKQILRTLGP